ncbi:MAG: exodeoxyribonuclease VII large subunit [Lachnobacterium sp.]|nr:exodeoxyribonuclease VII large subunit [Lachnobacterium sp.]
MNKNIYSVGQINNYIKNMFSQDFMLRNISVKGEISNCKYHTSGHIYFTIKDAAGTISAIMFAGSRRGLGFTMKEGDKVIVTGSVEVYEKTGSYQLYARQIELDGAGNLYLQFEKLKNELEEMGYFAEEYKIPIPKYARRIGIVTAPTGAAIQDIRNISKRRNPYVELILYPALVQGDGAAQSIVNGIYALEQIGVDIIIVGRGGGSIEDLWAFNEKIVADAIFNCRIPTISAVGHETDWTIADFVADMRAPTPSAAAELAVFDYRQVQDKLYEYNRRMQNSLYNKLELSRQKLNSYKLKLDYLSPEHRLNENRRRLMEYEEKLKLRIDMIIKEKKHMLELYAGRLEACSPVKKLGQGYAYVEDYNGKSLRSVEGVEKNQDITIYLLDGKIKTVVSEVIPNE